MHRPTAVAIEDEFLEDLLRRSVREGEEGLMLAILEDAVVCFQKYVNARDVKGKTLFDDAQAWLFEKGNDWIFSFENICETLRIEPSYLRDGLAKWKEGELKPKSEPQAVHAV